MNRGYLESVHKFSDHHRELLGRSELAGCFYCQTIFNPNEITDWIDGRHAETGSVGDGVTALCPRCGIDSVLPSAAPIALDSELLAQMRDHFFDK
jgi:hypothetical protein